LGVEEIQIFKFFVIEQIYKKMHNIRHISKKYTYFYIGFQYQ